MTITPAMTTGETRPRGTATGFRASLPRSLPLLWEEARPVVQLVFQLRFVAGAGFAVAAGGRVTAGTVVSDAGWLGVVLAVYLLNGVSDLPGDRANGSRRPLASGRLTEGRARAVTVVAGLAGSGACWLADPRCGRLALVMLVLGCLYSAGPRPAKNSPSGAALVCVGGGLLTFAAGALATGTGLPAAEWVLVGLLSAWMGVAGSTKDFDDAVGDALAGRRTLPVRLGDRRARALVGAGVLGLGAGAAAAALHYATADVGVALPAAVLTAGALLVAGRTFRPRRHRDAYRLFMLTQWLALGAALLVTIAG